MKTSPWKTLLSIGLAILFGAWIGQDKGVAGISFYSVVDLGSALFLNALNFLVVPLVASSIISGISRVGSEQALGRLGGKTFGFYLGTTLMAVLVGLFFVNGLAPGEGNAIESLSQSSLIQTQEERSICSSLLLKLIPVNIFAAFAQGQMLGVITFSLLFGMALSRIESSLAESLQKFWKAIFATMLQMTHWIMRFLPYGVFCLVAKTFATTGVQSAASLIKFSVTVLLGLGAFMFIALPILLKVCGICPLRAFKAMAPALLTAFSTSSSSASLPVTMECVEKRAGVSNRICSLVVPLGTSINMSGSALYECVAAVFIAQSYGVAMPLSMQLLIVVLSLVTSIGVAGIPAGGLVAISTILRAMGLPIEGIGLFIAVERLLDMCRTTVNVFSDSCCAMLVARSEGENVLAEESSNMA